MSHASHTISGDDPALLADGVRRAVDFRGDVTIETRDGAVVSGFAFDAQVTHSASDCIRILPAEGVERVRVLLSDIRTLTFSGKDAATGKSWENWLRRYAERKLAGLPASIDSENE